MTRDAEALFQEIALFIDESNILLKDGAFTQLTGLEDRIDILCKEVLKLSGAQRTKYADQLQQLIASLQKLQVGLTEERDKLNQQITGLSTHKKANVAYQKMEVLDKKKRSE